MTFNSIIYSNIMKGRIISFREYIFNVEEIYTNPDRYIAWIKKEIIYGVK